MLHQKKGIDVYATMIVAKCVCGWTKDRPRVYGAYGWLEDALKFHVDTYNKYVVEVGPSGEERNAGYKNVQLKFRREDTRSIEHGVQGHKHIGGR